MWFSTLSFCHDSIAWNKVVPYKSLPIKIDSGQPAKHIWVRLWNIKTFHLHDFVKFCLCISLHVCVLVWLSRWRSEGAVCVFKCACVCARSRSGGGGVSALFRFVFHVGKKWNRSHLPQIGPPRSGQKDLPKADPSCLPSLPLSGDFSSLGWGRTLCQSPSSNSSFSLFRGPLCIYHLFGSCYSLWRLMFADLPVTRERKEVPTTMPPASLVSQCFHSAENQELPQIMLCFNDTWAVPCFWLCYSIHTTSSWRSSTGRLAMSVFLWCTSDLPTPYERKLCMTEILFLVFLFFWTVFSLPNKICILASSVWIHNFNINWHSTEERRDYVEAQSNVMREGSRLKSPAWLWEGFTPRQPVSRFIGPHIDSHGLYLQNIPVCALHWYILLYKEPCHVRTEKADVPTAPRGFDDWPIWPSKVPILL